MVHNGGSYDAGGTYTANGDSSDVTILGNTSSSNFRKEVVTNLRNAWSTDTAAAQGEKDTYHQVITTTGNRSATTTDQSTARWQTLAGKTTDGYGLAVPTVNPGGSPDTGSTNGGLAGTVGGTPGSSGADTIDSGTTSTDTIARYTGGSMVDGAYTQTEAWADESHDNTTHNASDGTVTTTGPMGTATQTTTGSDTRSTSGLIGDN